VGIDVTNLGLYQVLIWNAGNTAFEADQVTGGTCTSGGASGTVTFTPISSYATGYHIGTASSGIQETWNSTCGAISSPAQNGQCNVILPTNNTSNDLANGYSIFGTLFLHGAQSALSGYGARVFCVGRGPCIQVGDLKSANDYPSITVQGVTFNAPGHSFGSAYPDYTTSASYAGVNIINTVEASGIQTITTASAHGFVVGDMVTIMFTDDSSYWGDGQVLSVPSSTTFTIKGVTGTTISSQATPGVVALAFDAVLDNGYSAHLVDLSIDQNNLSGNFNNFVSEWDDENATIDHLTATGVVHHGLTWSGSYIFSGGAAHAPNGQQFAPVITVRNSTITANGANCVTDYNSNGLYFENTVCQASGLWQVYSSNTRGNYFGASIKNMYSESNCGLNGSTSSPFPSLGIAGTIFGNSNTVANFSITGGNGVSGCTPSGGTGTIPLAYYITVHDPSHGSWISTPELVEYWNSTGTDSPVIKWPRVANGQDTITYDVVRMTPATLSTSTPPAYNGTPYPYQGGCPGGAGGICGSVATGLSQATACSSGLVCTFTDTAATASSAYTVPWSGLYEGQINFWPGYLVYVGESTVTTPVKVEQELAPSICFSCGGNAVTIADRCNAYASAGSGAYDICLSGNAGVVTQAPLSLPDGYPAEPVVPAKGRLIFPWFGTYLPPRAIATFYDSTSQLTLASPTYRPPWNANDFMVGLDGPNTTLTQSQAFISSGYSLRMYIGAVPNTTSTTQPTNWLESLTATAKVFNVPVTAPQFCIGSSCITVWPSGTLPSIPSSPAGINNTLIGQAGGSATWGLPGIAGRAVTGTTATDTIATADCAPNRVEYAGSVSVAVTLPTATTLAVPYCVFKLTNSTTGGNTAVTVTPTTWTINGNATLIIPRGQSAFVYVDPNSTTNWTADITGPNTSVATIASASTIAPTAQLNHVTGTTAIATISLPFTGFIGCIQLIPNGLWTTTTSGNIALASTAVVSKVLTECYDGTSWYPNY
jgi:hypothetical protein